MRTKTRVKVKSLKVTLTLAARRGTSMTSLKYHYSQFPKEEAILLPKMREMEVALKNLGKMEFYLIRLIPQQMEIN